MLFLTHIQCFRHVQRRAHAIAHLTCRSLLFNFKKGQGRTFTFPQLACLWVWLNMHHYLWISLNILEKAWKTILTMTGLWIFLIILHVWQAFEDTSDSKCARVLNKAWLCIQELCRVLNMSVYSSICFNNAWMSQYASMSLDMHKHGWILLNVPEYAWKFLNKLFWLCQGSQYASSS